MKKALLVVDAQYDFMPGGSLAVPEGSAIIPLILKIRPKFDTVVFTQDWHPANHCSFKAAGGLWPDHCIQNTDGAKIETSLIQEGDIIVQKGVHQDVDSYSGFWDNERKHKTELDNILKQKGIDTLYICGIATDYCVRFTALDAIDKDCNDGKGYKVVLVVRACRGLDGAEKAIEEMKSKGVKINYRYGKTKVVK